MDTAVVVSNYIGKQFGKQVDRQHFWRWALRNYFGTFLYSFSSLLSDRTHGLM